MGYYVRKLENKKSVPKWKVQYISCKKSDQKVESKSKLPRRTWDISKDRWRGLGFYKTMTIIEAKEIAKSLNAKQRLKRQEESYQKFQEQMSKERLEKEAFLPASFIAEFEERFIRKRKCRNKKDFRKISKSHVAWRTAQRLIKDIGLPPNEWFEHTYEVYDWFYREECSVAYAVSILKFMNIWCYFFCKKMGRPFLQVPYPRGHERRRLIDKYHTSHRNKKKASKPITPEMLIKAKGKINQENFNWLFISVWFGLRPKEVDSLKNEELFKIEKLSTGKIVLWVYQTKIISLPPSERWKLIPALFDEQEFALRTIESGVFKRPLVKTIKKHVGPEVSTYGGRKGFTDLMLEKGFSLEAISQWMGHTTINRTWRHYKNRTNIKFTLVRNV